MAVTAMELVQAYVPVALQVIGVILLLAGAAFSVIGGIGIVRLPEFYSRMHGAGITDTMGAGLVLVGLMFLSGSFLVAFKLFVILFFLTVTSPSSCHALAHSALAHGLKPVLDFAKMRDQSDAPNAADAKEESA